MQKQIKMGGQASDPHPLAAQNRQAALNAAEHELRVFPVRVTRKPGDSRKKQVTPLVSSWRTEATHDRKKINAWWDEFPDAVPGMPTGDFHVVDLDDRDLKNGTAEYKALGLDPKEALFAVNTPSGGEHLYHNNNNALRNTQDKIAPGIDTRGHGGFVFAPGARTIFGEYRIKRGDLTDLQFGILSDVPEPIQRASQAGERELVTDHPEPGGHDLDTIKDALSFVPNDGGHDCWTATLMAVHHATGGSQDGLALVLGWSAGYPGFSLKEVQSKWRSFGKYTGTPVTVDTLFMKAREHGWNAVNTDILDDLDDAEDEIEDDLLDLLGPEPEPEKRRFDYEGLTFATPAECAASDPRPYVIKGLLAERDVACIVGAPGVGKSLLAPRLAYAVAHGETIFERRVRQAGVFYVAAEDEHGMRGRLRALRDDLGEAENLHLVGGITDLLTTEPVKVNGKIRQRCRQADTLAKAVRDHKPGLVVIDTLAMSFPGLEENSAEGMGRVVALARRLTKWGAAVILIHHDTKDGQQGLPRGHSLLNGALDVSVHLRKNKSSGAITGTLTKNRNGSCDTGLAFCIKTAEIGKDEDGDPMTAAVCEPTSAPDRDQPSLKPTERAALTNILEAMGDEDEIDERTWRAVAQKDTRITMAEKSDSRRRVISEALKGLARKGEIAIGGGVIRRKQVGDDVDLDDLEEDVEGGD